MYVCLCHGITDRTIRKTIARGARTVEELSDACQAGSGCGGCQLELERMLAGHTDTLVEVGAALSDPGHPSGLRQARRHQH